MSRLQQDLAAAQVNAAEPALRAYAERVHVQGAVPPMTIQQLSGATTDLSSQRTTQRPSPWDVCASRCFCITISLHVGSSVSDGPAGGGDSCSGRRCGGAAGAGTSGAGGGRGSSLPRPPHPWAGRGAAREHRAAAAVERVQRLRRVGFFPGISGEEARRAAEDSSVQYSRSSSAVDGGGAHQLPRTCTSPVLPLPALHISLGCDVATLGTKSSLAAAQAGEERKRRNANCDPETERFLMKQCAFDSAGGRGAQAAGRQL